jgi:fructokinase
MNVAYGLARLGVDTRFLTQLGSDADGRAIRKHLASAGVKVLDESEIGAKTSISGVSVEQNGPATNNFDTDWQLPPISGLRLTKWAHVGAISTFLTPSADSLERLFRAVKDTISISYDPNIRPSILGDREQTIGRFERMAALAKVVKLSNEGAAWLYPTLTEESAMDKILTLGPQIVAITQGAAGARLSTKRYSVHVPSPTVDVADTMGAGDSFMAALISALLTVDAKSLGVRQLEQVAKLSVTAAAITCSRTGAELPSLLETLAALGIKRWNVGSADQARR